MAESTHPQASELDELMRNAELRDELEPYYDESISRVSVQQLPLTVENEYLASMLAWEVAPVLPIFRWFDPELRPPRPDVLSDPDLHDILWDIVQKLFEKRIVLDFTEHLSDRQLYMLIYRHILPSREKKVDLGDQLPALGLRRGRRRPGGLAPLLRDRGRPRNLGRHVSPTAAAAPQTALPPLAAPSEPG